MPGRGSSCQTGRSFTPASLNASCPISRFLRDPARITAQSIIPGNDCAERPRRRTLLPGWPIPRFPKPRPHTWQLPFAVVLRKRCRAAPLRPQALHSRDYCTPAPPPRNPSPQRALLARPQTRGTPAHLPRVAKAEALHAACGCAGPWENRALVEPTRHGTYPPLPDTPRTGPPIGAAT